MKAVSSSSNNAFSWGVGGMVVSNLIFSLMAILIRLEPTTDPFVVSFYRFAIGAALVASLALVGKTKLHFRDFKGLFWRGLIGGVSVVLYFLPINSIGLGKTSLFQYTYPFYAILFSALILKEKVRPPIWGLLALALSGLVLLDLPQLIHGEWNWMVLSAWASGVLSGLAVVFIKKLTATEGSMAIYLAQCLGGFWIMLFPVNLLPYPTGWVPALVLLGVGFTASIAQILMTWSYKRVDVSTGSLLGTMVPVLNVTAGILFFSEAFNPIEAVGAVITLVACFLLVLAKRKELSDSSSKTG